MVDSAATHYEIGCAMTLAWSDQLTELVDAGIPLRFHVTASSDIGDTVSFRHTLWYDAGSGAYRYADTLRSPSRDSVFVSRPYPQILIALREYSRWTIPLRRGFRTCRVEAVLLPSHVSRFNRTVDLSQIWGQRKISSVLILRE
jgi:hypothetical protein